MNFESLLEFLIEGFKKQNVRFALIGGFALHAAGYSRATNDIDFLVPKEDLPKAKKVLAERGYEVLHESGDVANFSNPLAGLFCRVDFLLAHREYSKRMLDRAVDVPLFDGKLRIKVVTPEDLIGLKVQSSSNDPERYYQDMADIEHVIRANRNKLDTAQIREYFALFKREKELDQILERLK